MTLTASQTSPSWRPRPSRGNNRPRGSLLLHVSIVFGCRHGLTCRSRSASNIMRHFHHSVGMFLDLYRARCPSSHLITLSKRNYPRATLTSGVKGEKERKRGERGTHTA